MKNKQTNNSIQRNFWLKERILILNLKTFRSFVRSFLVLFFRSWFRHYLMISIFSISYETNVNDKCTIMIEMEWNESGENKLTCHQLNCFFPFVQLESISLEIFFCFFSISIFQFSFPKRPTLTPISILFVNGQFIMWWDSWWIFSIHYSNGQNS